MSPVEAIKELLIARIGWSAGAPTLQAIDLAIAALQTVEQAREAVEAWEAVKDLLRLPNANQVNFEWSHGMYHASLFVPYEFPRKHDAYCDSPQAAVLAAKAD